MRITKITLNNFQAFPSLFELSLGRTGKNLLLYGENGSGKSSLYRALRAAFRPATSGKAWEDLCNVFSPPGSPVVLKLKTTTGDTFEWRSGQPAPTDPRIVDAGRRAGFLDYRSLLRLSLRPEHSSLSQVFFSVTVSELVPQFEVPVQGSPQSLSRLWQNVVGNPPRRWSSASLNKIAGFANDFNLGFTQALPQFEAKVKSFLNYFTDHHLDVTFRHPGLSWDKAGRCLRGNELLIGVGFRSRPIDNHLEFLNEARLSALALSIFLAGVALSNPGVPSGSSPPLRLLVIDDALIGLDSNNRLPLLEILQREFSDFQIILFTYDQVWFEIARDHTQDGGNWRAVKLYAEEGGPTDAMIPRLENSYDDLALARKHLRNCDLRAAAVYTRAAFEARLRNLCEDKRIKVAYRSNSLGVKTDILWREFTGWVQQQASQAPPQSLINDLEAFRSNVLNRLSHHGASSLTRTEVEAAIRAVEQFRQLRI